MKVYKTYFCGKMGGLEDEGMGWRSELREKLNERVSVSDDIKLDIILPNDYFNFSMDRSTYTYKEIYNWELRTVKSCDFVIVNLNYKGSQGTSHELAIANEYDIPVIAIIHDDKMNDVHPFDLECVDKVVQTFDDLVDYVNYYYLI